MTALLLSILTNAAIYVLFKYYEKLGINILPAIVINYITAFVLGLCVVPDIHQAIASAALLPSWFVAASLLGFVFIGIFYLMAITAQRIGVAVATIASKMSLALAALLFVWFDAEERLNPAKAFAILMAVAGVVLTSIKSNDGQPHIRQLFFPLLILTGSTVIDFTIAWFSDQPDTASELALYSCLSFGTAAATGLVLVFVKLLGRKISIKPRDIIAGILLGLVNYGSIYFLVQAYDSRIFMRSVVLPVNNLSVVVVGAIAALFLFREKFTTKNVWGLMLSVLALGLLLV